MLAVVLAALAQDPAAKAVTHWEHVLIAHEQYEDFEGGTGKAVVMARNPPLSLRPGTVIDEEGDWAAFVDGPPPRHESPSWYQSRAVAIDGGFSEALISWNAAMPPKVRLTVELRVGGARADTWSPWLEVVPARPADIEPGPDPNNDFVAVSFDLPITKFDDGAIDVDYFRSPVVWDRIQYRLSGSLWDPLESTCRHASLSIL